MRRIRRLEADRVAGACVVLLGAWFLWQALQFRTGPGYAAVGPQVFPTIVGLGFLVSGLALVLLPPAAHTDATDWPTLLRVALLLVVYLALLVPLGFVVASVVFLVGGAWALGSRAPVRDLVGGALVVVVVYLVFTRLLGIDLPTSPLGVI